MDYGLSWKQVVSERHSKSNIHFNALFTLCKYVTTPPGWGLSIILKQSRANMVQYHYTITLSILSSIITLLIGVMCVFMCGQCLISLLHLCSVKAASRYIGTSYSMCLLLDMYNCACAGDAGNVFPATAGKRFPTSIKARAWRTCHYAMRDR